MAALWVAMGLAHAGPYEGRVFSFLCAASFNWLCNRTVNFRGPRRHSLAGEYLRFLGVSAVGGAANYAAYSAVVAFGPRLLGLSAAQAAFAPYAGVMVGAVAGLAFNYTGVSRLVFHRRGEGEGGYARPSRWP